MAELIKIWENGGSLSVTYDGNGDGSAIFSSSENGGSERCMDVSFADASRNVVIVRTVRQAARAMATETYTRLTYLECDGRQYIDLGYIVKEDDVIEMSYISTSATSADKILFGSVGSSSAVWVSLYSATAYVRFGTTTSQEVSSAANMYSLKLQREEATFGITSTAIAYNAMPDTPINLFAGRLKDGTAYSRAYCRCSKFRISNSNGVVLDLIPAKRDSDGAIGMLDVVTGAFYTSAEEAFIAGSEAKITEEYEIIDYVSFDKDKLFDLGLISDTDTLEVLFQRSESSATPYLYGCVTSPHTASVTAYLSSGGAWRFGSSYKGFNTNSLKEYRVRISKGKVVYNNTSSTFSKSTFTTPETVVLGGYRAASGSLTKNYRGKVFYFRISDGDALRLDWVPCKRLTDGMEGFWDCVTQAFVEPLK